MKFGKFTIIADRDVQALGDTNDEILLNYDHIVSVKPINIVIDGNVTQGYWVRMTNGKKYRAIGVPEKVLKYLSESDD